ncbi:Serine/threonine-protein kinase PrkC [Rosistilla carotiformis]|uniref:Serine/threonine-protein kinase PrkC n=1 Tax=Rosistilla carotiformis TaxID=2528017 RepID=A0A518K1R0_9BACT|nr:Serine/threonine-protein kinase PrkC [Rosistilla carotiformis]
MNQPQAELSEETLRRFVLGLLDETESARVAEWLEKDPAVAARAAAIEPDSFLRKMADAGRGTHVSAMESTSVDRISSGSSRPSTAADPKHMSSDDSTIPNLHPELAALQQYRFVEQLGAGGMSLVYLAENLHMGRRKEALKILNESQTRQSGSRERFDQEIAVAAQLQHPNIVTAYSAMKLASLSVFAMQYVEGKDLDKFVRSKGAMRIDTACGVIRQVAAGLQYAMEMRTIHRDIKPANLMLTKVGAKHVVKILDFGLAKSQMEAETQVALTSTGMGMGTPQYMAPEQLRSAATVDIRADIYSLGCTLYFLLAGKPPFTGTQYEVYHAHQSQEAKWLNLVRTDVPAELAAVVAKMMAKEPSTRFQCPKDVGTALAPFLELKGPVPANIAGTEARVIAAASVPSVRLATQFESVSQVLPLTPRPVVSPQVQPLVQTHAQRPKPVSWKKIGGGVLVACVVFGFIAAVVMLSIRTPNGTIVFQQLPADAEVMVDGELVTVSWDGNRECATVAVQPGSHNVEVHRGGIKVEGTTVTVSSGENTQLVVRAEPPTPSPSVANTPSVSPPSKPIIAPVVPSPSSSPMRADAFTSRSTGMEFVRVRKGTFTMGSPDDEPERNTDETLHQVTLSQDFFLGKYEVTQDEYEKVMGFNPSHFKGKRLPVETVCWVDAAWFCNQLSDRDGRTPYYSITEVEKDEQSIKNATVTIQPGANGYRLPTEAEWEYACRAGETTPFSFGSNITQQQVNYDPYYGASTGTIRQQTIEVDALPGNRFGLHQMHGNVWEWCWDWYGNYSTESTVDPIGPDAGRGRVSRGGGWWFNAKTCRSASRSSGVPDSRSRDFCEGFRVAVNDSFTNSLGMKFVLIPAGTFIMGAPETEAGQNPFYDNQHHVTLTKDFYLATTEVTQSQWQSLMGTSPWTGLAYLKEGANYAATYVSWEDAVEFCKRLSAKENKAYRLPTEAEWEYACRAGTTTAYSFGDDGSQLSDYGWWGGLNGGGNAKLEPYAHEVGLKPANGYGLFDMHGNAWEWCSDYYGKYLNGNVTDPQGPYSGSDRVNRGGSWCRDVQSSRSGERWNNKPDYRDTDLGFRVAEGR